jgi:hypothetical protein
LHNKIEVGKFELTMADTHDKRKKPVDVLVDATNVREFILRRITEEQIDEVKLCEKVGVDWKYFNRYMNHNIHNSILYVRPSQDAILRILSELGAEVRILIIHDKRFEADKSLLKYNRKI